MTGSEKNTYHHGDLRASLIQAAISLLPTKGAAHLSLREVAKVAGVSHTAPYRHFEDKAALLTAIAQTGFEQLTQSLLEVVKKQQNDPEQQLISAAEAYVDLGIANPEMMYLMFGGVLEIDSLSKTFSEKSANAFTGLEQIIINGQALGIFKSGDSQSFAVSAWSLAHGLMMLLTAGQLRDIASSSEQKKQLSRTLAQNLLTGILK